MSSGGAGTEEVFIFEFLIISIPGELIIKSDVKPQNVSIIVLGTKLVCYNNMLNVKSAKE